MGRAGSWAAANAQCTGARALLLMAIWRWMVPRGSEGLPLEPRLYGCAERRWEGVLGERQGVEMLT